MNNVGDLVSVCWKLRLAIGKEGLPQRGIGVIINQELAERIHREMVMTSPGSDRIKIMFTRNYGAEGLRVEKAEVDKPAVPEPGEWFRVFDIPVVVVDC